MKIYYDDECRFCRDTVCFIKNNFLTSKIQIVPGQDEKNIDDDMKKYNSWVVVDDDGMKYFKFEALIKVFSVSPSLYLLSCFLKISLIKFIGDRIYDKVAKNRKLILRKAK